MTECLHCILPIMGYYVPMHTTRQQGHLKGSRIRENETVNMEAFKIASDALNEDWVKAARSVSDLSDFAFRSCLIDLVEIVGAVPGRNAGELAQFVLQRKLTSLSEVPESALKEDWVNRV